MLTVTYAECHIKAPYAECRYTECRYAECRYGECRYAECRYAECRYGECRYAECRYAECRGAKCAYVIFYNILCYFLFTSTSGSIQTLSLRITSQPFYHCAAQIDSHCQCQFF
jgi:hypothetical protein